TGLPSGFVTPPHPARCGPKAASDALRRRRPRTYPRDRQLDRRPRAEGPATTSRTRRFALIGALYSSQNLSLGLFTYAFLTIAQARGVPLATAGAAAGIATLLTLQLLCAPLVDRFGSARLGHYRGWLIATQSLLGLGLGSLALFDPATDFPLLLGIFAIMFMIAATQDIAADAAATR